MLKRVRTGQDSGHLDVLESVPAVLRHAVLAQCEVKIFPKGATVWTQGQQAGHVAFLVTGKAMSCYQSRNGKAGATGFWSAGDLLGAGDLGESMTRHMTVRCLEPCEIHLLVHDRFRDLVRRFPELGLAVIQAMSVRLRWVSQLVVKLETQSAVARICEVLMGLSERFGRPCEQGVLVDLALTNEDLAAITGISRQFTNTTLQDLRARGLIATRNRNLIIVRPKEIETLAQVT